MSSKSRNLSFLLSKTHVFWPWLSLAIKAALGNLMEQKCIRGVPKKTHFSHVWLRPGSWGSRRWLYSRNGVLDADSVLSRASKTHLSSRWLNCLMTQDGVERGKNEFLGPLWCIFWSMRFPEVALMTRHKFGQNSCVFEEEPRISTFPRHILPIVFCCKPCPDVL